MGSMSIWHWIIVAGIVMLLARRGGDHTARDGAERDLRGLRTEQDDLHQRARRGARGEADDIRGAESVARERLENRARHSEGRPRADSAQHARQPDTLHGAHRVGSSAIPSTAAGTEARGTGRLPTVIATAPATSATTSSDIVTATVRGRTRTESGPSRSTRRSPGARSRVICDDTRRAATPRPARLTAAPIAGAARARRRTGHRGSPP